MIFLLFAKIRCSFSKNSKCKNGTGLSTKYVWFKYDLEQKYHTPQVQPGRGLNSWPPDHDSTFHVTETPAITTRPSVTSAIVECCLSTDLTRFSFSGRHSEHGKIRAHYSTHWYPELDVLHYNVKTLENNCLPNKCCKWSVQKVIGFMLFNDTWSQ